jgi:hypothetical protein
MVPVVGGVGRVCQYHDRGDREGEAIDEPKVRSFAQRSSVSWFGMSPVLNPDGSPSRHSSMTGVETAGAIHIPTPAATKGWRRVTNSAAK